MSQTTKQRLEIALLALLFGAGAGWGAFQWQLAYLDTRLSRIEARLTDVYCATVPESSRAGCR